MNEKSLTSFLWASVAGVFLTALSIVVGTYFQWVDPTQLNMLEVFAVLTSYTCTILCSFQSRWNYPIGILTTFLYSWLFFQWEAYAMAAFNLYLVFSLIFGYWRWGSDADTKPVTKIKFDWWLAGYIGLGLVIYGVLQICINYFGMTITNPELWATTLSGVAQFMLDNKRLENWIVWAIVNIISIGFYMQIGLHLVAFQYIFFLGNTFVGYYLWRKSMKEDNYAGMVPVS